MLRELVSIFRSDNPLKSMGDNFAKMLSIAEEMTLAAGEIYFSSDSKPEDRTTVYERDVKVNKLERKIRKQVVAHLALQRNSADLPFCLFLMSLVKDVERIGDYAKNLAEVKDFYPGALPDDEIVSELKEIRNGVESTCARTSDIFASSDRESAIDLMQKARNIGQRCDALVVKIARSDYDSGTTTAAVLGTRFYTRIDGHVLNILSSVVMPLHKLDYYDEKEMVAEGG